MDGTIATKPEKIHSYKDLIVWQRGMELVEMIYRFTTHLPANEMYGLTSQLRRSAVSIPANIAEGRHRGTRKDFRQFLLIAFSSGTELETHLEITKRLGFGSNSERTACENLLNETQRMLNSMITKLCP